MYFHCQPNEEDVNLGWCLFQKREAGAGSALLAHHTALRHPGNTLSKDTTLVTLYLKTPPW